MYRTSKDYINLYKREETPTREPFVARKEIQSIVIEKNGEEDEKNIQMKYEMVEGNISEPKIWGPSFWFTLHNGANNYPKEASKIVVDKMKGFILGIPYMVVCKDCSTHAQAYIESRMSELDNVCSGRTNLFNFFVDFHNYVNKRYNKPELSYDDARKLYSQNVEVLKMSYSQK
jgi:hypothetical protein